MREALKRLMRHALIAHPQTPPASVSAILVSVERPRRGALMFTYTLACDPRNLILPRATAPARRNQLWKHTCFEAFIRVHPFAGYCEFNFSPSTEWAAYRFDSYREGMMDLPMKSDARIRTETAPDTYTLTAELEFDAPPPWRLALTAVIEETGGRKSYWALAHPPGKPDFHHADGFALELT